MYTRNIVNQLCFNKTKQKIPSSTILVIIFFFFFSFFLFLFFYTAPVIYGSSQARVESELSCWPTPQPQQHQTQATSVTYTTAHGNTGSLTHRVRPGIKPTSSQTLYQVLHPLSHNGNSPVMPFSSQPICGPIVCNVWLASHVPSSIAGKHQAFINQMIPVFVCAYTRSHLDFFMQIKK